MQGFDLIYKIYPFYDKFLISIFFEFQLTTFINPYDYSRINSFGYILLRVFIKLAMPATDVPFQYENDDRLKSNYDFIVGEFHSESEFTRVFLSSSDLVPKQILRRKLH